jgi:hypothetical protein
MLVSLANKESPIRAGSRSHALHHSSAIGTSKVTF